MLLAYKYTLMIPNCFLLLSGIFFEMVPEITGSPQQLPTSHNSPLLSSHSADNEQISPPVFSDFIIKDLPHNIKSMVSPYNDIQIVFSIK